MYIYSRLRAYKSVIQSSRHIYCYIYRSAPHITAFNIRRINYIQFRYTRQHLAHVIYVYYAVGCAYKLPVKLAFHFVAAVNGAEPVGKADRYFAKRKLSENLAHYLAYIPLCKRLAVNSYARSLVLFAQLPLKLYCLLGIRLSTV